MKKLLAVLIVFLAIPAFARHHFTVCYYNWTDNPVPYDNDVINPKDKWKVKGELVGQGTIAPHANKCFAGIIDETMILKHSILFSVDGHFYGIVNSPFSRPYVISNEPTAQEVGFFKNTGKLTKKVISGHENFFLNIHIQPKGVILSESADPKDSTQYVTPRLSK